MTQPSGQRPRTGLWIAITILLAASLAGTLWVPFYNRTSPALGGFPFFYWYQLLWVPIVAVLSWAAYALSKRARPPAKAPAPASGRPAEPGPGTGEMPR
jgi:hypothetical protein